MVVRGTRYTKLECVGRGGSSKVFKVRAPCAPTTGSHTLTLNARQALHQAGVRRARRRLPGVQSAGAISRMGSRSADQMLLAGD